MVMANELSRSCALGMRSGLPKWQLNPSSPKSYKNFNQRSVRPVPQSVTFDIVSRCFENKSDNC